VHKEFHTLKLIWLHQQNFRRHVPKNIVVSLAQGLKGMKDYIHQQDTFEVVFENATRYEEIQQRLASLIDDTDTQHLKWECNKRKLDYFIERYHKQGFFCLQPVEGS
jgi:hypothetical protein